MTLDIIYIIGGLVLLFFGGEWLVRGAVNLAGRFGLSTLLVSTVVVGFGTSMPELLVCVQAILSQSPDIALGNVIGSNIANILLILGISATFMPILCKAKGIQRDALAGVGAALLLTFFIQTGRIEAWAGGLMLLLLCGYLYISYKIDHKEVEDSLVRAGAQGAPVPEDTHADANPAARPLWVSLMFVLGGLAVLVLGARILVLGSVSLATALGVPEAVIGLSLVAVGTSLPELATAVIAAIRKHADVVIGNVLGSNLFNILGILGVTSLVGPITAGGRIAQLDIWILLGITMALYPVIRSGLRISRLEGGTFLLLYAGYVTWMFLPTG